ncbi:MAG: hypothetical protein ABIP56_09745 [Dokdonella sp.]
MQNADNEGHGFYKQQDKSELYDRILAFLDVKFGGEGDATDDATAAH